MSLRCVTFSDPVKPVAMLVLSEVEKPETPGVGIKREDIPDLTQGVYDAFGIDLMDISEIESELKSCEDSGGFCRWLAEKLGVEI